MATKRTTGKDEAIKAAGTNDEVAAGLAKAEGALASFEETFGSLRRDVALASESYAATSEARKREQEQWDYEEAVRRRTVTDAQKAEDAERAKAHADRETAIKASEANLRDAAKELLGVDLSTLDAKGIKVAREELDKKLAAAEAKGKAIGSEQAKREAEQAKALADAQGAAANQILTAEKAHAEKEIAELKAQNAKLQAAYDALAGKTVDLSSKTFDAAGGLVSQANKAMSDAATAPATRGLRG